MVVLTSVLFWPGLAFLAGSAGALVVRAILLAGLGRWASRSSTTWALGTAIRTPSLLWCAVFGLYVASEVALETSHLPPRLHAQVALVLEAAVVLCDQYAVQHELRLRLFDRLRAEGITLAVPARVIRVSHEREAATHE
jgi:hypothetical protein